MAKYILKKVLYLILTMWIIITATFYLMNTLPGDPIQTGTKILPPNVEANLKAKWGLDKPLNERYVIYMKNLLKGEMGESMKNPGQSANDIIREKFPVSARLGIQAMIIGSCIGIILGIISALKKNSIIDRSIVFFSILGVSIPSFVFAALLQKWLGGSLLPIVGWPTENIWFSGWEYTVIPTLAAALGSIATYSRFMKSSVLDVLSNDYILTAKAKGLSKGQIIKRHVLRNSMIPIVTIFAPQLAGVVTGSFVIERIFAIPGLGKYYVESVTVRDFTMIMATTVFFAFLFIVSMVLMDILYCVVDPRVRIASKER